MEWLIFVVFIPSSDFIAGSHNGNAVQQRLTIRCTGGEFRKTGWKGRVIGDIYCFRSSRTERRNYMETCGILIH